MIYGIHNRSQKIEDIVARKEARKVATKKAAKVAVKSVKASKSSGKSGKAGKAGAKKKARK